MSLHDEKFTKLYFHMHTFFFIYKPMSRGITYVIQHHASASCINTRNAAISVGHFKEDVLTELALRAEPAPCMINISSIF